MKNTLAMLAAAPALAALLDGCAAGGYAGAATGIGQAAAGAAVNSAAGAMVNSATGAVTGSAGGAVANSVTGAAANSATGAIANTATGAIANTATGTIANTATGAITNTATGALANTATGAAGAAVKSAAGAAVQSATGAMVNTAIGAATGGQGALNAIIQSMATNVFNGQIGQAVQSADQDFRLQKLGGLMQSGKLDEPQQWYNPQSGNRLAVRPLGPEVMDPSLRQRCRDLEETYTLGDGRQLREMRRACRDSAGQWALVQ